MSIALDEPVRREKLKELTVSWFAAICLCTIVVLATHSCIACGCVTPNVSVEPFVL